MKSIGEYKTELLDALDSGDFDSFFNLYQNISDDYRNNNGFDEFDNTLFERFKTILDNSIDIFSVLKSYLKINVQSINIFGYRVLEKCILYIKSVEKIGNGRGIDKIYDKISSYDEILSQIVSPTLKLLNNVILFDSNPNYYNWLLLLAKIKYEYEDYEQFALKLKPNIPQDAVDAWLAIIDIHYWKSQVDEAYFALKNVKSSQIPEFYTDLVNPRYIDKLKIKEYLSLKDISLQNLSQCKEIYFLGENGVGKTILLQAILLSLKKTELKSLAQFRITVSDLEKINAIFRDHQPKYFDEYSFYPNIFAYGVGRLKTSENEVDKTGFATLFDRQQYNLTNPISFFKEILLRQLANTGNISIEKVLDLFREILNIEEKSELHIERNGTNFVFEERNTVTEFKHIADGYRSILLILADLLSRLIENQPDVTEISEFKGIVLIDEIDMLLHPKLEYTIVRRLREKLPNIQWFFSTHSPMLILGASDDAVFYKLYKEDGVSKISEQWTSNDVRHLMANGIITSPLFDMPTARMTADVDAASRDTSASYLQGVINDTIKQRIDAKKKKGKVYFSKDEIKKITTEAIEALKEGRAGAND